MKTQLDVDAAIEAADAIEAVLATFLSENATNSRRAEHRKHARRRAAIEAARGAWVAAATTRAETVWNEALYTAVRDCYDIDALRGFAKGERGDIGGVRLENRNSSAGASNG